MVIANRAWQPRFTLANRRTGKMADAMAIASAPASSEIAMSQRRSNWSDATTRTFIRVWEDHLTALRSNTRNARIYAKTRITHTNHLSTENTRRELFSAKPTGHTTLVTCSRGNNAHKLLTHRNYHAQQKETQWNALALVKATNRLLATVNRLQQPVLKDLM